MAQNFRKIVDGINIVPKVSSTANSAGDIDYDSTANKLNLNNGSFTSPIVTEVGTATLTNKTLTAPVISTIVNTGTLTLPTSTDTLVGRDTTDTLTNKTISGLSNTITNIQNSSFAQMAAHTYKGNNTGSASAPLDVSVTDLTADLNAFIGDSGSGGLKGSVPAPAAGDAAANKFLKADGTWSAGAGAGVIAVGTFDSQAPAANGLVVTSGSVYAQSASATVPGMVNTAAQSFNGLKTFNNNLNTTNISSIGGGLTLFPAGSENLTLQTGTGRLRLRGSTGIELEQNSSPTAPASGYDSLYFKSDDLLYSKNSAGVEREIGGGANSAGMITMFGGTSAPSGYFICDGSDVSRTTYSALFAVIGTAYGVGDGSLTFNIPDLRGLFPRGVDNGAGNDPDAASRTATNGGNSGDMVGSYQPDELLSHSHTSYTPRNSGIGGAPYVTTGQATPVFDAYTTSSTGGNETRPKNVYVNYIIKY